MSNKKLENIISILTKAQGLPHWETNHLEMLGAACLRVPSAASIAATPSHAVFSPPIQLSLQEWSTMMI